MMFPCPAFGTPFLAPPFEDVVVEGVGSCTFLAAGAGGGSSSEKDSQAGSSCVTGVWVSLVGRFWVSDEERDVIWVGDG